MQLNKMQHSQPMKANALTIQQIEALYQNGQLSEFEYRDLMFKAARRQLRGA